MRNRHVPGPLLATPDDLDAAIGLLLDLMPVVCTIAGMDKNSEMKLTSLLRSDFKYLRPVFGAPVKDRPVTTVQLLAKEANLGRAGIYRSLDVLAFHATECALALVMVLAARGAYCDSTVWQVCELDSPVGREASGPGIVGSRQRLFGLSLTGGDVEVPTILHAPKPSMNEAEFVLALDAMLEALERMNRKIDAYASENDKQRLDRIGMTASELASYDRMGTLVGSELHLGPLTDGGWEGPVQVGTSEAVEVAVNRGFERVVLECNDDPYQGSDEWVQIRPFMLRKLAGLAPTIGLDVGFRPSRVTYLMHNDGDDRGLLHRRQHAPESHEEATGAAVAGRLSYSLAGFDLGKPTELGPAIAYGEFLATNEHGPPCRERFGEQLTPSLVKAQNPESRTLVRALRIMFNAALVAVVRQRQARSLDS
ncbi:MAG: hypothetical protein QOF69_3438 [Solirubrobacteraceae bacterium]|nr:hypothetical protein [Solirubrobacteraceae bacterium]